jgi:DNA-binding Lrp family transcriptional regulator
VEYDAMMRHQLLTDSSHALDKLDYKILNLMTQGLDNKTIAYKLKVPLSTVQRRTRILLKQGYAKQICQLDYKKLGLNKGLIHVYIGTGKMKEIAEELLSNNGIISAGVHVGNSDIVGEFVYEDSEQLVDLISRVKHMDEVERIVWSEEIYLLAGRQDSILAVINRIIDRQ